MSTKLFSGDMLSNSNQFCACVGFGVFQAFGLTAVFAVPMDVLLLQTSISQDATSSVTVVFAADAKRFPSTKTYDVSYEGRVERIDHLVTAAGIYSASGLADVVVRRGSGPTTDIVWYKADANTNERDIDIDSREISSVESAFGGNNLLVGSDNLFANRGDVTGNITNVERLDYIFSQGLKVDSSRGFAIFDRGLATEHDGFKIVAITSLGQDGAPNGYGSVVTFELGEWGETDLVPKSTYLVMRKDGSGTFRPSRTREQSIGGTFITLTDLARDGSTIFGYSLLAPDTKGNGDALINWNNPGNYPSQTLNDNDHIAGGLDPIGVSGVIYTVPEPSTLCLAVVAGVFTLRRKSRMRESD